ncbi:MAG: hypothetical protein BRD55_05675 [Bacteroidetes bacterium SW_9_63_38]|nr:MAG: hypothetical protein BRD55_05675 [Bacteroidetes bacterium SW_9_63_38]
MRRRPILLIRAFSGFESGFSEAGTTCHPDIIRRFHRSIANFWETYRCLLDQWYPFSNAEDTFQEVAFGKEDRYVVTDDHHFEVFRSFLSETDG